jgi:hypothetical protein
MREWRRGGSCQAPHLFYLSITSAGTKQQDNEKLSPVCVPAVAMLVIGGPTSIGIYEPAGHKNSTSSAAAVSLRFCCNIQPTLSSSSFACASPRCVVTDISTLVTFQDSFQCARSLEKPSVRLSQSQYSSSGGSSTTTRLGPRLDADVVAQPPPLGPTRHSSDSLYLSPRRLDPTIDPLSRATHSK